MFEKCECECKVMEVGKINKNKNKSIVLELPIYPVSIEEIKAMVMMDYGRMEGCYKPFNKEEWEVKRKGRLKY